MVRPLRKPAHLSTPTRLATKSVTNMNSNRILTLAACAAIATATLAQNPTPYPQGTLNAPAGTLRSAGASVAAAGDVNGDGVQDLVAGFPHQGIEASDAGSDQLPSPNFAGTSGFHVWSPATGAIVRTIVDAGYGLRGFAIANLGDVDGDGRPDHAVSDPIYGVGGSTYRAGRVDAYSGATGSVIWSAIGPVVQGHSGVSLARIADVDNDGRADLLVGSIGTQTVAGRVYVLSGASGQILRTHLGAPPDTLGWSGSDVGDVDGDNVSDYAAGAPYAMPLSPPASHVRIWSGATGALIRTITSPVGQDRFGRAIAPAGDLDGDNVPDLFVGAPGNFLAGRAYAISGATGAVLTNMTRNVVSDRFGWSLAAIGDKDGDGKADVALGTRMGIVEVRSGATGGVLYVQSGLLGYPAQSTIVMRPTAVGDLNADGSIDAAIGSINTAANGVLVVFTSIFPHATLAGDDGQAVVSDVAALGDLDGDGLREIAISNAIANTQPLVTAGTVRIWSPGAGAYIGQLTGGASYQGFGQNVATLADVNNDGVEDFLVSSLGGGSESVTCHSGATGQALYTTVPPVSGGAFGYFMTTLGDIDLDGFRDFAVGAPYTAVAGQSTTGRIYVCSGANGSIIHTVDGVAPGGFFGGRIADVGDATNDSVPDLIVGAPYATFAGISFAGAAHVVSGFTGTIVRTHVGTGPGIACGNGVAGLADLDGDLIPDYAVASPANTYSGAAAPGPVIIYSGATASVIRSIGPSPIPPGLSVNDFFGHGLANAGDLDGDGKSDLLLGAVPYVGVGPQHEVHAYSGATGALIAREFGPGPFQPWRPAAHACGFDLTGDGVPDWVSVNYPSSPVAATANARIVSRAGLPFGVMNIGAGCINAGLPPVLQTAGGGIYSQYGNPVFELLVSRAAPNQNGILVGGASNTLWNGNALPLDLTAYGMAGCSLYASIDAAIPFVTTAKGVYGFPAPVPMNPALAGTTGYVQAFLFSAGGAPIAATNGLAIVVQ
jgi:hypothetical protein